MISLLERGFVHSSCPFPCHVKGRGGELKPLSNGKLIIDSFLQAWTQCYRLLTTPPLKERQLLGTYLCSLSFSRKKKRIQTNPSLEEFKNKTKKIGVCILLLHLFSEKKYYYVFRFSFYGLRDVMQCARFLQRAL